MPLAGLQLIFSSPSYIHRLVHRLDSFFWHYFHVHVDLLHERLAAIAHVPCVLPTYLLPSSQ